MGETLKLLRIFYGYKSVDMAKKLNISQSFLSEIENSKKNPTLELLKRYSKILNIKVSTIVLLSESLEEDKNTKKDIKHNLAGVGMKVLKILKKNGELDE